MKTDTALVLGNGPSLDTLDAARFDSVTTFGTNRVFVMFTKWQRECDNVVITDHARIREIGDSYRNYGGRMFVGYSRSINPRIRHLKNILGRDFIPLKQMVTDRPRKHWLSRLDRWPTITRMVRDRNNVSFDFEKGFNFGGTVVGTSVQVAVALGFKRILLVGVDAGGVEGKTHCGGLPVHPPEFQRQLQVRRYENRGLNTKFSDGSRAYDIRLKLEPFLVLLQLALEETDCELIDCTPNGKLRFIPKGKLEDYV
jgi:hypothetical protein